VIGLTLEGRDRATVLIHYYRGMVGRADVWRMRMDATSNWALGATAAVISFSLGNSSAPHYVVHMAALMTLGFLLLEARRLTFYHLWQQRVLRLEEGLIAPAMVGDQEAVVPEGVTAALLADLGRTVPTMPLSKAVARRLRRVYLYVFSIQFFAWGLKLGSHPTPSESASEWVARAAAGPFSGPAFIALSVGLLTLAILLAITRGGLDRSPAE